MTGFKNILVPVDFDETTAHGVAAALDLAREYDARVTLMHAWFIPPMPYGGPFAWVLDEIRESAQTELDRVLADATARYPHCDAMLYGGDPQTRIIDAAAEKHADLIVLGSHGRRGLSRYLLGSVAENVLRRSPVPVLIVPPPQSHSEPVSQAATTAA